RMTKPFSRMIPRLIVLLFFLFLTSCRSTSSLLLHPEAPELNRRSPDVFEVCLETTKGRISIEVHRDWSPHGADRFYNLVCSRYSNDTRFFRVIKGRWAQFGINGDPKIAQTWRAQTIPDDPRIESNARGTVAYAFATPNGRTTQVFINLKDNSATHDAEFVPFGKVVKGMEVADALNAQYGESAGGGIRGGKQDPLYEKGKSYLQDNFPLLDGITRATIVESQRPDHLLKADARIQFGGTPVELAISEVSQQSLRIELSSLAEQGHGRKPSPSGALVPFLQTEKLRVRELSRERRLSVGQLRVTVRPHPLSINVCRADGKLVQELIFGEDNQTNLILFRTAAPVLGLGEGAEQFDRRGVSYPLINGQRYRLAELGTRIFSP